MPTTLSNRIQDPNRLAALTRTALRDATADAAFDRLTRLATRVLGVPVALVSLVDAHRQVFKGAVGLGEPWATRRETPLSHSFCQHVVASSEPLIIEDARAHPLVRDNLAIPDLGVVAYAGIPLTTADGYVLGSFCAIDHEPRRWSEPDIATLRDLAAATTTEIELQTSVRQADLARREKEVLLDAAAEGIFGMDADGLCTFINPAACRLLGYTPEECLGRNMHELTHYKRADGTSYPIQECPIFQAFSEGRSARLINETLWRKDGSALPALYSVAP
ncbi:MAG: PAS domain-containing protein, partial [Chloroflexota bacterium]|nr:PAS domain-containing protein [Chloroflexota bacterium]